MMKDPLVRQRSQAPPLTVAVTLASQTVTGDSGPNRVEGATSAPRKFLSVRAVLFISHVKVVVSSTNLLGQDNGMT